MRFQSAKRLDRLAGGVLLKLLQPVRALRELCSGYVSLPAVREIAVVKFWGIGNAALMLPVLGALRTRYPGARLTVVTLEENVPIFRDVADSVLAVRMGHALSDLLRVAARLRRERVDLALDFEQYVRSSQVLLYLAGARQVLAFDTPDQNRAGLADVRVRYDDTRHIGETFLDLARAAGVHDTIYAPGGLGVDPAAAARVAEYLPDGPLVVLHPGSGDNFPGRRWPTRRFGLLARRLVPHATVVVTGTKQETPLAREVCEASKRPLRNLAGRLPLPELVALLARATLLVSNDTGPVHLASALGVPVLGLYGPNTPRLYGPLSAGSRAFFRAPPCAPCITNFNYKTSRCKNPVCIRAIDTDEVAEAALALLGQRTEKWA